MSETQRIPDHDQPSSDGRETGIIPFAAAETGMSIFNDVVTEGHNFPRDPREQGRLRFLACSDTDRRADDIGPEDVLEVRYYYAHMVEIVDDGGEVNRVPRTVLILKDNSTVGFVSEGVFSSVANLHIMSQGKPFDPCLPVKLVKKKAKRGTVLTLRPYYPPAPEAKQPPAKR